MSFPELPTIIETPNHFWFGPVDLSYACQGDTKVEKLDSKHVKVTKLLLLRITNIHQMIHSMILH